MLMYEIKPSIIITYSSCTQDSTGQTSLYRTWISSITGMDLPSSRGFPDIDRRFDRPKMYIPWYM